jgi:RNA recognition motif-containing protein
MRKIFNNIYVKNFPVEWEEAKLREVFGQYGNIKSLIRMVNAENNAPFAFICFDDPEN